MADVPVDRPDPLVEKERPRGAAGRPFPLGPPPGSQDADRSAASALDEDRITALVVQAIVDRRRPVLGGLNPEAAERMRKLYLADAWAVLGALQADPDVRLSVRCSECNDLGMVERATVLASGPATVSDHCGVCAGRSWVPWEPVSSRTGVVGDA